MFGQADFKVTDALKVTAGARWVQDDKDFRLGFQRLTPIPISPLTDSVTLKNTYSELTPKFGVDYTVDSSMADSMLLYASAARGFKSGGYNGINITNANIARAPYGPESNWTYGRPQDRPAGQQAAHQRRGLRREDQGSRAERHG